MIFNHFLNHSDKKFHTFRTPNICLNTENVIVKNLIMKTFKKISPLLLILVAVIVTSCGFKGKKDLKKAEGVELTRIEVSVSGMSCTGCEQTIQSNVAKIDGIYNIKAAFTTGKAIVDFNPSVADTSEIRRAIVASGYGVIGFNTVSPPDSTIR
jgi:copper chaperone CopZ